MEHTESAPLRLGVLATETSWYWRDLQRAAAARSQSHLAVDLQLLTFTSLFARLEPRPQVGCDQRSSLANLDALLVRTMPPGTLEQVVFRMNALHRLEAMGTRVINPARSLEVAVDKYLALAMLQAAGLCVPRTRVSQTCEIALQDFHELGGDVVVKPLFGSEGRGIVRVTDEEFAWRVFRTYQQLGHVIYQQQFIPHSGSDLRVLILGPRHYVIRRRNANDWRTNVSRGAVAEPFEADDALIEIGRRAAQAVGAPFAGVDVLPARDGQRYVLEVNAVPGWQGLAKALRCDISAELLNWICSGAK